MKKISCIFFTILLMVFGGCSPSAPPSSSETSVPSSSAPETEKIITFYDDDFAFQVESISVIPNAYIGKIVEYSGYFCIQEITTGRETVSVPLVLRDTPEDPHGCTTAGFEIDYQGDYPENGQWVKVTGVFDYVIHSGMQFLMVQVSQWEPATPPAGATTNGASQAAATSSAVSE